MSEAAVEVSKQFQLELEEERSQLKRDLDTFEQKVWTANRGSLSHYVYISYISTAL